MLLLALAGFLVLASQSVGGFQDLSARATAARQANDLPQAIALYKEAVQVNPKWEEGWWYLGSLLYDSNDCGGSRKALSEVVELDPKASPAWGLLGLCEFDAGDYDQSLTHIQRSLLPDSGIEPQMEKVLRYHEALLLTRYGQFEEALKRFVWFADKRTQNPELITAIGMAALRTPRLATDLKPEEQQLYQAAGTAVRLSMTGQFGDAETALRQLVEDYPTTPYVHYLYGCFLLNAKPDVALNELRQEVQLHPSSGAANAMLAWVLLQHGDAAAAQQYAGAAVGSDAKLALAQYAFGRCLLEQGKTEEAINHLLIAEKSDPASLDTHVSLATAYSRAGRPREARRERMRSLEISRQQVEAANR
jgi:tetratricopeptide (TPR) repeat protein